MVAAFHIEANNVCSCLPHTARSTKASCMTAEILHVHAYIVVEQLSVHAGVVDD